MNSSRVEWKVGLFVLVGLALLGGLILNFSSGPTRFQKTYQLHVIMPTLSTLKPKSSVMMAGVPVGDVLSASLIDEGRKVDIVVSISQQYPIHADAQFRIESVGFLGDQYIAITPTKNLAPLLVNNATVTGEDPFNLQEAVRSTAGLLDQARTTLRDIDQAVTSVNRTLLSAQTMSDFSQAISNFQAVTESAVGMAKDVQTLIESNKGPASEIIGNLRRFSSRLDTAADSLNQLISTNSGDVHDALLDVRSAAANIKQFAADLESGPGLAASLVKDPELSRQLKSVVTNANDLAANLSLFSSNLNQRGLWSMLWKPKTIALKTNAPPLHPKR